MLPRRKYTHRLLIGVAAILSLVALAAWRWQRQPKSTALPQAPPAVSATTEAASPQTAPTITTHRSGASEPGLEEMFGSLRTVPDAKTARQRLAALREALSVMPTKEAVAAVRQFLDSKADVPTHLGFKLGANGLLEEAPSLRTFLLDELARLDPAAAADYAKVVLGSMDSPDEWAVALRSLALGDTSTAGRALLKQKTGELLQYAPWQQNPSTGFLEAFDVAVYLGGTDLIPTLSDLVRRQDNPAVAHAAYLALDRLVIGDTTTILSAMEASLDLMQGRESTRADYFARVDVRDPQQRKVLESYLLDPRIGAAEMDTFANVYPNANFMISPNLLTQTPTLDRGALTSRDAESLAVAQQWLADPRFANLKPELQKIIVRLQTFVQQANRGR
jgi:hypothetical protein